MSTVTAELKTTIRTSTGSAAALDESRSLI